MPLDFQFYVAAVAAVSILGLAKGGFAGIGAIATPPLLLLVVDPARAASIILPILLVQDAVSVWIFRRDYDAPTLLRLLPYAAGGVMLGYLLASKVSPLAVELALGAISILFGLHQLLWRPAAQAVVKAGPVWLGPVCGLASGFTSQLAHAGGPPIQIYFVARRFERDRFIGTMTWLFAAVTCASWWLSVRWAK